MLAGEGQGKQKLLFVRDGEETLSSTSAFSLCDCVACGTTIRSFI